MLAKCTPKTAVPVARRNPRGNFVLLMSNVPRPVTATPQTATITQGRAPTTCSFLFHYVVTAKVLMPAARSGSSGQLFDLFLIAHEGVILCLPYQLCGSVKALFNTGSQWLGVRHPF